MAKYEKVKFYHDNKGFIIILRITGESPKILRGIEVNLEGDEVGGKGYDERMHIISKDLIEYRKPMIFDLKYGTLKLVTSLKN